MSNTWYFLAITSGDKGQSHVRIWSQEANGLYV